MLWKAIVALVLFVAAAAGGVTLYARYQVKSMLDDLAAAIAPVAEMRYASLSVTPRGTVRVQDVEIRPNALNEPLRMEGIEVETPGLWFLLTGSKSLRDGHLPEHLRATFRGLAFSLNGPMALTIDRLIAGAAQSSGAPPVSNCGDIRYFDFGAYQRVGYGSLVFDMSIGYRFEKGDGPLRFTLDGRVRDLGMTTVTLEFAGVSPSLRENMAAQPSLRAFEFVYQDLSYTDRLKRYCAQASRVSVQQYIDSEVTRTAEAYGAQWGLVLGPGLREAYRQFLTTPGEVRVQGKLSADLDLPRLRLFKPAEIMSKLNLRVSVNGKAVTDLSMTSSRAALPLPFPLPSPSPTHGRPLLLPPTLPTSPPPAAPAAVTGRFRAVPTSDLAGHLEKTVRLHLTDGTTREGRLLQVAGGMARVERRQRGGVITHAIPTREINGVEVLF